MKYVVKLEKDSEGSGCGVPGCAHGCSAPVRLDFSYYVLATSQEDAERYVRSEIWDGNFTFTVEEAGEDGPEMDTFATPSYEARQFEEAYDKAQYELDKAERQLHGAIRSQAAPEVITEAMNRWRHWIEECAFLRGG